MDDVVGRLVRAMNAHDLDAVSRLIHPDYRSVQPAHPGRDFVGRAQLRANWESMFAGIPDLQATVGRSVHGGGTTWTEWQWAGTGPDGAAFDMRGVAIFEIDDDRIVAGSLYMEEVDTGHVGIDETVRLLSARPAGAGADRSAAGYARELDDARRAGRTLDVPFTDRAPLSQPEAYAIQRALTQRRLDRGERIVGWKLGYTSVAMREQMGVAEPNHGPLTDAMLLPPGGPVPASALQPRIEPEIALTLARPVPTGASVDDVLACCASARACLEVVDSVWTAYRFTVADNTADGSSAGWVVLGDELPLDDLPGIEVELRVGDAVVGSAAGSAAGGHPARGVAWLAEQLADDPRGLRAGDVIITGGLTSAYALQPGHVVSAGFTAGSRIVSVACGRGRLSSAEA